MRLVFSKKNLSLFHLFLPIISITTFVVVNYYFLLDMQLLHLQLIVYYICSYYTCARFLLHLQSISIYAGDFCYICSRFLHLQFLLHLQSLQVGINIKTPIYLQKIDKKSNLCGGAKNPHTCQESEPHTSHNHESEFPITWPVTKEIALNGLILVLCLAKKIKIGFLGQR